MNVKLIAHTALSDEFLESTGMRIQIAVEELDRAAVALTAIRTCYSPNRPSEIVALEGEKYFGRAAKDGEGGTEADRLFRHIVRSGHASTLEHITYTFAIEGVSRSLLAQLTRHRQFSFSVQSQRYVKFGSVDKSGGFDYVMPESLAGKEIPNVEMVDGYDEETECVTWRPYTALDEYENVMQTIQTAYDRLREIGIPAEDARFVLPNAAACNLVMTGNLRAILEFYRKRKKGKGAQWEIAELAERIREEIVVVDGWTERFFEEAAR